MFRLASLGFTPPLGGVWGGKAAAGFGQKREPI